MNGLLDLNSPTVWPSYWGGWVVDDGSMPVRIEDRRSAFAEAAARVVPPATTGAAGSDRSRPADVTETGDAVTSSGPASASSLPLAGHAPGPVVSPNIQGPGATYSLTNGAAA